MIPDRLKLKSADPKQYEFAVKLCTDIELLLEEKTEAQLLIDEWNDKISTGLIYEAHNFEHYYASISRDTFIRKALSPSPTFDNLLTYTDSLTVIDIISKANVEEHELDYYLDMLEANFPDAKVSDLLYWPDEWFGNGVDLHIELTNEQKIYCLSSYTNRWFADQPKKILLPPKVKTALKNKIASQEKITQ